ncbi:MAG TPA: MMPL family transporter [Sedimentisphaerales bacterium]|nr:MMPL family transporter [Sedimentisphaerales bacterium]HRS13133.1 MMPL family transporter [Sedimentisphaerales bacterium]
MTWIEDHLGEWVVRHRWWIILLMVPTSLVCAVGITRIQISNDTRVFFGADNPDYRRLKALEHTYSREQSVDFLVAPRDGNIFTRETLTAVAELTEAGWQLPRSAAVHSITNYPSMRAEGDDLIVENLVPEPNTLTDAQLETIRRKALSEKDIVDLLLSRKGHVAGVHVGFVAPQDSPTPTSEIAAHARRIVADFRTRHPDIEIYLTGSVIMDEAFAEASRRDLFTLGPIAFLVMSSLVGISLRSFYGTFSAVSVTVLSLGAAMGLVGWLGVPVNAVSVGAPVLMLTLAVADNIHLLTTMFHCLRHGYPKHAAVAKSVQMNLKAVCLTSITTVIGFLTMNFSESPPFRDLGNIVGIGVLIDLVNSILLLPALMAVLPVSAGLSRDRAPWVNPDRLADFVIRRRKPVVCALLAVTAVCSLGWFGITLDDNFLMYFDRSFAFRRATDFMIENLRGWDVIEYSLYSGRSGGITDPAYMATVDRFAAWYRQQPKVVHVTTIVDTFKRLNRDMNGGDERFYRLPERSELAAQYLLFYELSLPFGHDLNSVIDVDRAASRFTVTFESMSATELLAMDEAAGRWLTENAPAHMVTAGTGLSLAWAHITARNIRSMLLASLGEILTISCIMVFVLRSLRFVLLFLIPNLTPPFLAFGIWGMTKGQVGLALSVVLSMTLGIIVDDTIHFFIKYFQARKADGLTPEEAVRSAFHTVGSAIGITTVVLVAGFAVMTVSPYRLSEEMGLMCAMVIGLALLLDFFLSPTLLMRFDRGNVKLAAVREPQMDRQVSCL